jgi:hypothetical protein
MTRTSRTRTRFTGEPAGGVVGVWNGVNFSKTNAAQLGALYYVKKSKCDDSHGRPIVDSNMSIESWDSGGRSFINGHRGSSPGFQDMTANNLVPGYYNNNYPGDVPIPNLPAAATDAIVLASRTNPSRPGVTPLSLIQDLVELPKMLKDVGRLIRPPKRGKRFNPLSEKDLANQYLGAKFGWIPLIRDIQDLIDLQKHIHERSAELKRLYDSGGLKRTIKLGSYGNSASQLNVPLSTPAWMTHRANIHTSVTVKRWGSIRWKPTTLPSYYPADELRIKQAAALVSGMTYQGLMEGAWDVIPWTWLLGWFTNVREFATQHSNAIPATSGSSCIMTHRIQRRQFETTTLSSGLSGGDGFDVYERKERYVGPGSLGANLPFINGSRLAILGALFVQRFK